MLKFVALIISLPFFYFALPHYPFIAIVCSFFCRPVSLHVNLIRNKRCVSFVCPVIICHANNNDISENNIERQSSQLRACFQWSLMFAAWKMMVFRPDGDNTPDPRNVKYYPHSRMIIIMQTVRLQTHVSCSFFARQSVCSIYLQFTRNAFLKSTLCICACGCVSVAPPKPSVCKRTKRISWKRVLSLSHPLVDRMRHFDGVSFAFSFSLSLSHSHIISISCALYFQFSCDST